MYIKTKPFVKWAGGKSQIINEIRKNYPQKIKNYCEPFVGGGAVLFDVLANYNPDSVLINDINQELIITYNQIKNNVNNLIENLYELETSFLSANTEQRKTLFNYNRSLFNSLKNQTCNKDELKIASLFIFLNKTCFNGLYRVNKSGDFNVPIGAYKKPLICDKETLKESSTLLQNVKLQCSDYSSCANFIKKDTFVYIDPPYRPITQTASFTSYTKKTFDDKEQIRLAEFIDYISKKGAIILASNSDPKNTNKYDMFFDDLYKDYKIKRIPAKRMINSKGSNRGNINEILISNF